MSVSVETIGNTKRAELKWNLHNVTSLEWQKKKTGERVTSPDFHAVGDDKVKWYIQICPNGDKEEQKGCISAFLHSRIGPASRPPVNAKYTFTAVSDKERKKVWSNTSENTFGPTTRVGYGWKNIFKLADVLESNFFSLFCKLEYPDPNPAIKIYVLPIPEIPLNNEEPTSSVIQDLEKLFINRSGTDVTFFIEGKEIKAHKAILLARSPVFAAMMESGMKESIENRIEIDDIVPDIFEALLRFIYTDRVDVDQLNVQDLLVAANKYMLSLLKLNCQKFLSERLTTKNCVEKLALADLHSCEHLKRSTLNFILRNRDDVMQSDDWKDLKIFYYLL